MPQRLLVAAALCLAAAALAAQTASTVVPVGISVATENAHAVNGVDIRPMPDGTVWFLVPSNDRIVQLQGATLKQWQLRDDKHLGVNPVKFELDGDVIWYVGNGESLIDPGRSTFSRLDTATGALREWVVPGSKPGGFWRGPDGLVWIAQTDGRLQSLDLNTLEVTDYRSRSADGAVFTFAYADMVQGPDQALWMADFGNNRIVRYEPGADHETSWTILSPSSGRLNPSQIRFDHAGRLWISELTGSRMDLFDPSTNLITSFSGFFNPVHFDLFEGRVYVAEAPNVNGSVAVLDPLLAVPSAYSLTPLTVPVRHIVNGKRALIRDSVITPTTFASSINGFADSDFTLTSSPVSGFLRLQYNNRNAYGIAVADGYIWTGSDGKILRLLVQNIGNDNDLAVPYVFRKPPDPNAQDPDATDRVDVTLANTGGSTIAGSLLFMFSPGSYAASAPFSLEPNKTAVLSNVFADVISPGSEGSGPVRILVTSGTAPDLRASARSLHVRGDGANFGFSLPALSTASSLGVGDSATLFTGSRESETATLGVYTSSAGAGSRCTLALVAADGTVRGTRNFNLANNTLEEFTPPASAFGLPAQAGDAVQITGGPGSLRAYVRIADSGSGDAAVALPVKATGDAVLPWAQSALAADGTGTVTDLFVSNPDPANPASVTVSFFPSGPPAAPASASLTLPPGATQVFADVLQSFLGATGSGALTVSSNVPVATAARQAARRPEGDYAAFLGAYDGSQSVPAGASSFARGLQELPGQRSTDLVLFNRGAATTATVVGFDGNGSEISRLAVGLASGQTVRLAAVLHQLGLDGPGQIDNAGVRVDAPAGSQLYAAFVQTDAVSGDAEWTAPQ